MLLQHSRKPVHEKCLPKCLRAEEEVLAPLGDVVMSWGASISMHLLIVQNHWFDSYFEHLLGFTIVFKEAFSPTSGVLGKLGPWRFPQQIEPLENFVWHIGSLENWVAVNWAPGKCWCGKFGPWRFYPTNCWCSRIHISTCEIHKYKLLVPENTNIYNTGADDFPVAQFAKDIDIFCPILWDICTLKVVLFH